MAALVQIEAKHRQRHCPYMDQNPHSHHAAHAQRRSGGTTLVRGLLEGVDVAEHATLKLQPFDCLNAVRKSSGMAHQPPHMATKPTAHQRFVKTSPGNCYCSATTFETPAYPWGLPSCPPTPISKRVPPTPKRFSPETLKTPNGRSAMTYHRSICEGHKGKETGKTSDNGYCVVW
eukprot:CAMPEP_0174328364 /NCGR_PEP_ID=MMETSP0810-20121108/15088_1 /TAXON_ID=73025 ORGANISM="Eutreptiella gymnastica-like, Strain CCMP1594" /NCGR_SAMPLE_ID=MMETSP0810 /ASSEMBLY_ACC=CAM_ASM_000659 /LENGTH=174 /DNA_ID=CAMNT_0015442427 /DNA_START=173 /DNA_END=694 /DNA_ORIENTATION=+